MKGNEQLIIWAVAEARRRRLSPPSRPNDPRETVSVPFAELKPSQEGFVVEWQ